MILGKHYGTHYVKRGTAPTGWQNSATNPYPITNRDNGTQSTLAPPTTCLATAQFDFNSLAEADGDNHMILQLTAMAYMQPGDDITLSMVLDQFLNSQKGNVNQSVNSVQMRIVSVDGVNANAQSDATMAIGANPGVSYSTV